MTVYKLSELPKWARKAEKVAHAVVQQATSNMLADIKIVPGITRDGGRVRGTIPRDLGALARSLQSTLYGGTAIVGPESYVLVAASMKAGDVAQFTWGGNIAPYARAVHYGSRGVAGTFWVDVATTKWKKYVAAAVKEVRNELK